MQIKTIELTSRNVISNGSSFQDSKTAIRFLASKQVRKWSRTLISSLCWPNTQNEAQFNWYFLDSIEKRDFLQMNPNIGILYIIGNHFFATINNAKSLPQNKASFGSD